MKLQNPIHQMIYNEVVKPAMLQKTYDADGIVTAVDYYRQLVDVEWIESDTGQIGRKKNLNIPRDADGIFRQAPKVGTKVKLSFRNGNKNFPHITMFYSDNSRDRDFFSEKGASIPKGIGYI